MPCIQSTSIHRIKSPPRQRREGFSPGRAEPRRGLPWGPRTPHTLRQGRALNGRGRTHAARKAPPYISMHSAEPSIPSPALLQSAALGLAVPRHPNPAPFLPDILHKPWKELRSTEKRSQQQRQSLTAPKAKRKEPTAPAHCDGRSTTG